MSLRELPTTNLRILVSLALVVATAVKVLITWQSPPTEWLIFLGSMLGLDTLHFAAKRATYKGRRK